MRDKYSTFLIDYHHGGEKWSFDLLATSWNDAEERLRSIKYNAYIEGEVKATIPARVGWWVPLATTIRNLFHWMTKSS